MKNKSKTVRTAVSILTSWLCTKHYQQMKAKERGRWL